MNLVEFMYLLLVQRNYYSSLANASCLRYCIINQMRLFCNFC